MSIDNIDDLYDELREAAMEDPDYCYDDEADREFGRDPEWRCAEEMEEFDD